MARVVEPSQPVSTYMIWERYMQLLQRYPLAPTDRSQHQWERLGRRDCGGKPKWRGQTRGGYDPTLDSWLKAGAPVHGNKRGKVHACNEWRGDAFPDTAYSRNIAKHNSECLEEVKVRPAQRILSGSRITQAGDR